MSGFKPFLAADETGIAHYRRNNGDGTTSYLAVQDNDPILDANKALATHNDGYSKSREMRRVASIPLGLIHHWKTVEGWDAFDPANAAKLMQKLNSNEFEYLRTAPGQLGVSNGVMR
jgi:hypothetical protein